jgi:small subunit ribosomal protein S5
VRDRGRSPASRLLAAIGTSNKHNVIHATVDALKALKSIDQVAKTRGKSVSELQAASGRKNTTAPAP